MEVKIVIIEATGYVEPQNWLVQTRKGKLVKPLAGGEYRRMIKNGDRPVHLYVVSGKGIRGNQEEPFYNERLKVVDRYFDTHRAYKDANELVEVLASTNSERYSDIPCINS